MIDSDGTHDVAYRATNEAGTSEPDSTSVALDLTAPSTEPEVFGDLDLGVHFGRATLSLESNDASSGLAETHFRLSDDADHTIYSSPVTLPSASKYRIEYRAVDLAGNTSEWEGREIVVADSEVMVGDVSTGVDNRVVAEGETISDRERGRIVRTAARSDIGHD